MGATARGKRPLLVILVEVAGAAGLVHGPAYYFDLIFGSSPFLYDSAGNTIKSVAALYQEMSLKRFEWTPATSAPIGPIQLDATDSALDLVPRAARILEIVQQRELFDFEGVGTPGLQFVGPADLGVLVIDNSSAAKGATRYATHFWRPRHTKNAVHYWNTLAVQVSFVGSDASFNMVAHELCHNIGINVGIDLYGDSETLHSRISLMGPEEGAGGTMSYHLDPWHKMRLAWCEPRQQDVQERLTPISVGSPGAFDPQGPMILFDASRGASEYFILEFRTPNQPGSAAFDREISSDGVAIWHVAMDTQMEPLRIAWGKNDYRTVFTEAQTTSPMSSVLPQQMPGDGFQRGGNVLWNEGTVSPVLRWLDSTALGKRVSVRWYESSATYALLDLLDTPVSLAISAPNAVATESRIETFWIAEDLRIHSSWQDVALSPRWAQAITIASAATKAAEGSQPVAVARLSGTVDVFWTSVNGEVLWVSRPVGSQEWSGTGVPITPPGSIDAGSRLRAVSRHEDHLDVFWARADGTVLSTWSDKYSDSGTWQQHLFELAPAGSCASPRSIAALAPRPEELVVFWAGTDGHLWQRRWYLVDRKPRWDTPNIVVDHKYVNGRTAIGAVCKDLDALDLFWAGPDGTLFTSNREGAVWTSPWALPGTRRDVAPGSDIAVAAPDALHLVVCWVGQHDELRTLSGTRGPSGGPWKNPHNVFSTAIRADIRAELGLRSRASEHLDLAFVQTDGSVAVASYDEKPFLVGPNQTSQRGALHTWNVQAITGVGTVRLLP
jgi:M6 family metalloprotease-like protein